MPKRNLDSMDDYDMEIQEPSILPMTTQSANATTSGSETKGRGHHGETQVSKKTTRFNPIDETEQVIMPFRARGTLLMDQNASDAAKVTFRLNSIYDIIHGSLTGYNSEKAPGADTPDAAGSQEIPHYRPYWEKLYNYWHVIKCEWTFNYRLKSRVNQDGEQDWALILYEHGLQPPPTQTDINGTKQLIPWYLRKYHPHVRKVNVKTFTTGYASATENRNGYSTYQEEWQTVSGEFQPGNIKHEVVEDEYNQTWHKFTQVPPTAEKLTIMFQPNDRAMTDTFKVKDGSIMGNTLEYEMVMVFTVQLKDRKFQFQFLQQGSDFPETKDFLALPAPL